jgi:tRNA uridine 5-carboxymethylaminomethyl modification enzyme
MFTSRVEYRLLLREDNADLRLRETGHKLGLVSKADYLATQKKNQAIQEQIKKLKEIKLRPSIKINARLKRYKSSPINKVVALEEILRRPEIKYGHLKKLSKKLSSAVEAVKQQVEIQIKYSGFIQRQLKEVERFKNLEKIKIPPDFDYQKLGGLSKEVKEKLSRFKPLSLGQASRISGVTPAAISILMVRLKK